MENREAAVLEAIRLYDTDAVPVADLYGPCWTCDASFGASHVDPCEPTTVSERDALRGRLALELFRSIVAEEATVWDLEALHTAGAAATARALARLAGEDTDATLRRTGRAVHAQMGPPPPWHAGS